MLIDWSAFTPWVSLVGGLMIGVAAAIYLLLNGKTMGVSGIVNGLLHPRSGDIAWRVSFISGLAFSAICFGLFGNIEMFSAPQIDASTSLLIIGGVLLGLGARLCSGCTSGHGICGIARGSMRSVVATLCFMVTGAITVYFLRHVF